MGSEHQEFPGALEKRPKKRRLFFALWPDKRIRKEISTLNRELPPPERGGRLMRDPNLHLTLHYIGPVDEGEMACIGLAARKVKGRSFKMVFDRLGYFKRPRVLWLGCEEIPEGYTELMAQLSERIEPCGFKMEVEGNRPHVTLRRKVLKPREYADIKTIVWAVDQFVLVESVPIRGGVSYQVVETYPLNSVD